MAVVTGASRGIGRAIAERLGREGVSVVVNYAGSADAAQEAVSAIEEAGGKAVAVQADTGQIGEVRGLFEEVEDRFGRLDILVNNAGVAVFNQLAEVTEEEFDQVFAPNVKGVFFSMQEAARRMEDGGRIISISSAAAARMASPGSSFYAGSKAAVEQFTEALAQELGERGITVNAVSPSATDTDTFEEVSTPEGREQAAQATPLGRLGQPEDIADVVAFIASEESRWITGQVIQAGGGAV